MPQHLIAGRGSDSLHLLKGKGRHADARWVPGTWIAPAGDGCQALGPPTSPPALLARLFSETPEKPVVTLWQQRGCQKRPDFTSSVGVWQENSAISPKEAPWSRSPAGPCRDACCSGPARSSTTSPRPSSAGPSGSIRSTSWHFKRCRIIIYVELHIRRIYPGAWHPV